MADGTSGNPQSPSISTAPPSWDAPCSSCGRGRFVDRQCSGCNAMTEFCGRCDAGRALITAWDVAHAPHIEAHKDRVSKAIRESHEKWLNAPERKTERHDFYPGVEIDSRRENT
jgi:hypothetical protein